MRRSGSPCVLVVVLLLAGPAGGGEPPAADEQPQAPERFLRDWVAGEARYDLFAFFHEHASDVHRTASEHFEVAVKVLALRTGGSPEVVAELSEDLARTFRADSTPEDTRLRALHVLGRLAAPGSLPLLVEASQSASPEHRAEAIRGLGFHGNGPAEESFLVYGGRIRYVVLPAAPSEAATKALLDAADALRTTSPAGRGGGRGPFRRAGPSVSFALKKALASHRSAAVAEQVAGLLRDSGSFSLLASDRDDLATLLARCAPHGGLEAILTLGREEDEDSRRVAARALGRSALRAAVAPLLALLGDSSAAVRTAANLGLVRLAGLEAPPADSGRAAWAKRLGENGERFDPERAKKLRELEPGIYRLGS